MAGGEWPEHCRYSSSQMTLNVPTAILGHIARCKENHDLLHPLVLSAEKYPDEGSVTMKIQERTQHP